MRRQLEKKKYLLTKHIQNNKKAISMNQYHDRICFFYIYFVLNRFATYLKSNNNHLIFKIILLFYLFIIFFFCVMNVFYLERSKMKLQKYQLT